MVQGWSLSETQEQLRAWRASDLRIGLVPTMGALHAGHLSLISALLERVDRVLVTVFVNPTQFGSSEDLSSYPRQAETDVALASQAGAHGVWLGSMDELYPSGFCTTVTVAGPALGMEGEERPGHFAGVATIVTKLIMLTQPQVVALGEKDYQQLQVIRRLVTDLHLTVEVLGCPIIRDHDGLALSSRNQRLSHPQRAMARSVPSSLRAACLVARQGGSVADMATLSQAGLKADYMSLVHPIDLSPIHASVRPYSDRLEGVDPAQIRLITTVPCGPVRLLDNCALGAPP